MRVIAETKRRFLRITLFLVVLAGLSNVFLVHNSLAVVYKYVDKNGTESFTNSLDSVPEKYRKTAVIIKEKKGREPKGPEAPSPENKPENKLENKPGNKGESAAEQEGKISKIVRSAEDLVATGLFQAGAAVIVFLVLFIFAGKIGSLLGFKDIGSIFRILLVLLLLVFLYSVYSRETVNTFTTIKREVRGIKKQSNEKDEKVKGILSDSPDGNKK
jgi:hypothetical protein